jgi:hypothetical protein
MITIHSNDAWVNGYIPRVFTVETKSDINGTGDIAALNWYSEIFPSDIINSLIERYQHVLVYFCEPFPALSKFSEFPQVTFLSDVVMDVPPPNHKYIGNWFMTHDNFYQTACWANDVMAELDDHALTKPYYFDALLGARRPHREVVHKNWQTSQCRDKILLTYHGNDARRGIWHAPCRALPCENVDTSNPDQLAVTLWSLMPLPSGELGHRVGSQHIIPTKIYNDSWFSIITEGFTDHLGTRLTEKTAKAMAGQRLFVYFGAPHDLARMRRLGFQTFGDVLDESYDDIKDDQARWHAAWQQVEWLCSQDPVALSAASREQRAHNKRVFLETDWHAGLRKHLREICAKY